METQIDIPVTSKLLHGGVVTIPKRIRSVFNIEIGDLITFQIIKVTKKKEKSESD